MSFSATASQTVGPYFSIGLSGMNSVALCAETVAGEHIEVSGRVFNDDGQGVPDAQLELWQPDCEGRFAGFDPAEGGSQRVSLSVSRVFLLMSRACLESTPFFRDLYPYLTARRRPHTLSSCSRCADS
jgi:protocatechuate 3,4-dioxygenase beta subunit